MTSTIPRGRGPIRQTVESLLRAERETGARIDAARQQTQRRMRQIAGLVREAGSGAGPLATRYRALADRIDDVAAATTPSFTTATEQTRAAFASEVHALLELLNAEHHPDDALPPLAPGAVERGAGIDAAFPDGFAREYVATVAGELDAGDATSKPDADSHPVPADDDITAARRRVVDTFSPHNREQADALLAHPDSHAVALHGPHVTAKELELRVGWTRPPNRGTTGADNWRYRGDTDGRVKSGHRISHEAAAFTTPEAFARPLDTFLDVANRHPGGLDGYLDQHFPDGVAPLFIDAERAHLHSDDAHGYRGAGTGTRESASDWVAMRTDAMRADPECLDPVRTIAYDPINDGTEPGVRLIFTNRDGGWALTTYYPASGPGLDNIRLEDLP